MTEAKYIKLEKRALIEISGEDARNFLQGLITNNINKVSENSSIYALMLTPQGKFLFEFFIFEIGGKLMLDCDRERINDLIKRLTMYKLRSKIEIRKNEDYTIISLIGEDSLKKLGLSGQTGVTNKFSRGVVFADPRDINMGVRAVILPEDLTSLEKAEFTSGTIEDYEKQRIMSAIPDHNDMEPDKSFPLQFSMEELNAVDFKKGCYVGQEVTARTKYRGVIRKKIFKISGGQNLPEKGSDILIGEKIIGETLSSIDGLGLALLEVEEIKKLGYQNIMPVSRDMKIKIM